MNGKYKHNRLYTHQGHASVGEFSGKCGVLLRLGFVSDLLVDKRIAVQGDG